jgi:DNA adenine methylase
MLKNLNKAPFVYFGGKSQAAPTIWESLGDCNHYVEPFMGSLAVLLNRPHEANRSYYSETVNDLDGLLVNAWRAIQIHPDATADAASNPVAEADLHARHSALNRWRAEHELEHLMGDPAFCDPVMAGWWIWGQSCWIGSGWCSGRGPWVVDETGRLVKRVGPGEGQNRVLPHIGDNGHGVNHAGAREPGVSRQRPHIGNNGSGVNHAGAREPGVSRQRPHIGDDGSGVNHAGAREPGVSRQRPHLSGDGQGVNWPQAREPGPEFWDDDPEIEYHPVTMPEVLRWFRFLSARLRHVRILNGDWKRAVTKGASLTLSVRQGLGPCGVFLDPPYAASAGRDEDVYSCDSLTVAHDAADWALEHGDDPRYRIVLAGFEGEHAERFETAGWRCVEWFKAGFLRGGMGNVTGIAGGQQARERLWCSPHCLVPEEPSVEALPPLALERQASMFGDDK